MTETPERKDASPAPGYWDQPENKVGHPDFWTAGLKSSLPPGAVTRTSRGSLINAVISSILTITCLIVLLTGGPLEWHRWRTYAQILWPLVILGLSYRYWKSWRVLRHHEAGRASPLS